MAIKFVATNEGHAKLRNDFLAVVRRTAPDMPAEEILAVTCVLVGQLIAMQDQRRFTSDTIMNLVWANIESGNKAALDELLNAPSAGRA